MKNAAAQGHAAFLSDRCVMFSVRDACHASRRQQANPVAGAEHLVGFLGDGAHVAVFQLNRDLQAAALRDAVLCRAAGNAAEHGAQQASGHRASTAADGAARRDPADGAPGKRAGARWAALDHDFAHALNHAIAHGLLALCLARCVDAAGIGVVGTAADQRHGSQHCDTADSKDLIHRNSRLNAAPFVVVRCARFTVSS